MTFPVYYADDSTKSELVSSWDLSNSRARALISMSPNGSTKPKTNYINGLSCSARNSWYSFGYDSDRNNFWLSEGHLEDIATLSNNKLTIEAFRAYDLYEAIFWSEYEWHIEFIIWL